MKSEIFLISLIVVIFLIGCKQDQSLQEPLDFNKDIVKYNATTKESTNQKNETLDKVYSDNEPICKFLRSKDIQLEPEPLNGEFVSKFYSYRINTKWRDFIEDLKETFPGESYYSLEGRDFPAFFNEGPVIANVWSITETKYKGLESAKKDWLDGIVINADRDFTNVPEKQVCKDKIKSGEDAYFIKTNFYRKSKGLNYSRYDVLAFKNGKTFTITLTIAYSADFNEAEEALHLDYIAKEILKSLKAY